MNQKNEPIQLKGLHSTRPMPVMFVGHGSPMNAIEDNTYSRSWQTLGHQFGQGKRWPKPQLIVCISAHWLTEGWALTGMQNPPTIHDFGGFPPELFAQQYPAPGAPDLATQIAEQMIQPNDQQKAHVDEHEWGFDHGTWSVLKPMFPNADIPVIQLSMDYSRHPREHLAMGAQLDFLREQGVLILGSGNTVHNLSAMQRNAKDDQAYEWTVAFDHWVAEQITKRDHSALADFLKYPLARQAHPGHDHFLPLLYAAGASRTRDEIEFFNDRFQLASVAMRSIIWDSKLH